MGSYHISYMVQHGGENRKDKFVKLLDHIPSKLACEDAIFENSKHWVIKLWEYIYVPYKYINDTTDRGISYISKSKLWLYMFLKIGKLFNLHNVNPYMHCLMYHVPFYEIVQQIHQKKKSLIRRNRYNNTSEFDLERKLRKYNK